MARRLMKFFRYIVLISVLCTLLQYYLVRKSYIFSPRNIKTIGEKLAGQPPSNCLEGIHADLKRNYGSHLIPASSKGFIDYLSSLTPEEVTYKRAVHRPTWFAFTAGGFSGKIHLLHVSTTEYIAIIGTPFRSSGVSGIHWMNQSCTVLSGSMQRLTDSSGLRKEEFLPGSHARFAALENALVELADDTWLLCYGRGFIPASSVYVTLGSLANGDMMSPLMIFSVSAQSILHEMSLWFQETCAYYLGLWK